jgi:hypothetical protein
MNVRQPVEWDMVHSLMIGYPWLVPPPWFQVPNSWFHPVHPPWFGLRVLNIHGEMD